jgi:hypothetical protein
MAELMNFEIPSELQMSPFDALSFIEIGNFQVLRLGEYRTIFAKAIVSRARGF